MGTGYAKTSPTPFATGEVIEAADFTTEFNLNKLNVKLGISKE